MNLLLDADRRTRQELVDALGVAACLVEHDGENFVVVAMNDPCRAYYGLRDSVMQLSVDAESVAAASGRSITEVEPIVARTLANYGRCVETKAPVSTENAIRLPDGSVRWSRNVIRPVMRDEEIEFLLVSIIDVTETMRAQRELEESLLQLVGQHVQVCRSCRRVRGESGDWQTVERYMAHHRDLNFTHGICDNCAQEFE